VRKGAPHGFRYAQRLLDLDFAPWVFYVSPKYRLVHISGWLPSNTQRTLLQWVYDVPNVTNAKVCMSLPLVSHHTFIFFLLQTPQCRHSMENSAQIPEVLS
jgi:hypothetical protein